MRRQVSFFTETIGASGLATVQLAINQVVANYTNEGWDLEHVVHDRRDDEIDIALYFVKDD
jgi:hypothetical protein